MLHGDPDARVDLLHRVNHLRDGKVIRLLHDLRVELRQAGPQPITLSVPLTVLTGVTIVTPDTPVTGRRLINEEVPACVPLSETRVRLPPAVMLQAINLSDPESSRSGRYHAVGKRRQAVVPNAACGGTAVTESPHGGAIR